MVSDPPLPIGIYCRHFWQEVQDRVATDAAGFGAVLIVPYDSDPG